MCLFECQEYNHVKNSKFGSLPQPVQEPLLKFGNFFGHVNLKLKFFTFIRNKFKYRALSSMFLNVWYTIHEKEIRKRLTERESIDKNDSLENYKIMSIK